MENHSKQVYFFIWGEKGKNKNIDKSTKKPIQYSIENPPNKFTLSFAAEKQKQQNKRNMNNRTKDPMETPMENLPNKFTF